MGVMCSLLGHDYGDPEVERERDENGDEVVLTAKRVQRCQSCGHERTISENTEVTALSAAAGVVREPDGTVVVAPDESTGDGDAPKSTEAIGATDDDRAGVGAATARNGGGARAAVDSARDDREQVEAQRSPDGRATEDASSEMRRVSDGSNERSGGIADSVTAESALGRPTDRAARAGADDSAANNTAIDRIDDEPPRRTPPQRAPGEWPAEPEHPLASTTGSDSSTVSGGSVASTGQWPSDTDADSTTDGAPDDRNGRGADDSTDRLTGGSFVCASCGFDAAVIDSPHRAGDICPDCHRGYLAWETRKG